MRAWLCFLVLAYAVVAWAQGSNVEKIEKGVVRILAVTDDGLGTGSGFVIADGIVVTNHHVAGGTRRLEVASAYTSPTWIPAELLWSDAAADVAVLKVKGLSLPTLPVATSVLRKGDEVWALGYPGMADLRKANEKPRDPEDAIRILKDNLSLVTTVSRGNVAKVETVSRGPTLPEWPLVAHYATIAPGNSGGPLLDNCGRVVGINTLGKSSGVGPTLFLASHISTVVEKFSSDKEVSALGIRPRIETTACTAIVQGSNLAVLVGLGVVSGTALLLALRRPRQQVFKVIERASTEVRHLTRTGVDRLRGTHGAIRSPAVVLTGFTEAGTPLRVEVPRSLLGDGMEGFVIGRSPALADGVIEHESVSRRHARFIRQGDRIMVEDLNSSVGTFVNGARLSAFQPTPSSAGDSLRIGDVELRVFSAG